MICACGGSPPDSSLALTGVAVVDLRSGSIAEDQTVVVRGERIVYVGAAPPADTMADAVIHDHAGDFVIPGLWDMHVHFRNSFEQGLAEENTEWLSQYLGFGVTAVRDAGGDLPEAVLEWRQQIETGERRGPRIFTSLRKLDGAASDFSWPGSIEITSADDIGPALDRLVAAGADFVKLYDGSIDGDLYLQAIAETERRGLRSAGHMPLTIRFEDAIAAGLDSVEHEIYLSKAVSADEQQIAEKIALAVDSGDDWSFSGALAELQAAADPEKLARALDLMIERGAALTPTLHIGAVLDGMTDPADYENDPRLAEVTPGIRDSFSLRLEALLARSEEELARDLAVSRTNRSYVKIAADRGVTILAGSDTGAVNSFMYPGDSLHHELEALVTVGLAPLQALQAATFHAAAWLGEEDHYGTVEAGKVADLVILQASPLADITNTRRIAAVVQSGEYLGPDILAALKRRGQSPGN